MVKPESGEAIGRAAFTVTAAGPAQASSANCQESLRQHHYVVGPKVRATCNAGQTGAADDWRIVFADRRAEPEDHPLPG